MTFPVLHPPARCSEHSLGNTYKVSGLIKARADISKKRGGQSAKLPISANLQVDSDLVVTCPVAHAPKVRAPPFRVRRAGQLVLSASRAAHGFLEQRGFGFGPLVLIFPSLLCITGGFSIS